MRCAAAISLLLTLWARPAAADLDDAQKQACADAYDNSQVLRDEGQLELARAQLAVCRRACPEVLARDCERWQEEIEAKLPPPQQSDTTDGEPDEARAPQAAGTNALSATEVTALVLGSLGSAALVVAGALAIQGHVDRGDLYDCRPRCPQQDVDAVASLWTVSGVVAGAGAAALGLGLVLWLTSDEGETVAVDATGLSLRF